MAKANATRNEKDRVEKRNEISCGGACEVKSNRLCRECADWGLLITQSSLQPLDVDTRRPE